jgi:hypothetical protein
LLRDFDKGEILFFGYRKGDYGILKKLYFLIFVKLKKEILLKY